MDVEIKAVGGCAKATSDLKWSSSDISTASVSASKTVVGSHLQDLWQFKQPLTTDLSGLVTLARLSVVNRSLKVARKFTAVKSQQLGKMVKIHKQQKGIKIFPGGGTRYKLPFFRASTIMG
ncbi:hypothetical protein KIW84_066060 [Lathyrus oleraceus]|uniref:Uncharacterized protein n=1 Tax=Pisum sativum TaxID=3888 RepID=A0A9D4WH79_PEA|nr:hypothetical protein KIW84_066060 [Pisum sativum]